MIVLEPWLVLWIELLAVQLSFFLFLFFFLFSSKYKWQGLVLMVWLWDTICRMGDCARETDRQGVAEYSLVTANDGPVFQINLRLILVSGKTHEFLFSPSDSAAEITDHVFSHWPEGESLWGYVELYRCTGKSVDRWVCCHASGFFRFELWISQQQIPMQW